MIRKYRIYKKMIISLAMLAVMVLWPTGTSYGAVNIQPHNASLVYQHDWYLNGKVDQANNMHVNIKMYKAYYLDVKYYFVVVTVEVSPDVNNGWGLDTSKTVEVMFYTPSVAWDEYYNEKCSYVSSAPENHIYGPETGTTSISFELSAGDENTEISVGWTQTSITHGWEEWPEATSNLQYYRSFAGKTIHSDEMATFSFGVCFKVTSDMPYLGVPINVTATMHKCELVWRYSPYGGAIAPYYVDYQDHVYADINIVAENN